VFTAPHLAAEFVDAAAAVVFCLFIVVSAVVLFVCFVVVIFQPGNSRGNLLV